MSSAPEPRAVLITRPEPGASEMKALLSDVPWVKSFKAPLTRIEGTGGDLGDLGDAEALLFTSPRAPEFARGAEHLPAYTVGRRTGAAARERGFSVLGEGEARLDESLAQKVPPGTRLLHLAGEHLAGDPERLFKGRDVRYRRIVVYRAAAAADPPGELLIFLRSPHRKLVTFMSARPAAIFAQLTPKGMLPPGVVAICASERVREAAEKTKLFERQLLAPTPELPGFVDFVVSGST